MKITIDHLTIRYGDTTAVDDLSLEIPDGELVVLLGPSGCGKTSAMRAIAGLETPVAGRIDIGEEPVFDAGRGVDVPIHARRVGMVFQSYAIWPHHDVLHNVIFPLRVQGKLTKQEMRAEGERILEMVGLGGFADRSASKLSGGQMQRVALARSIAMKPRVLLLDEPLSNLDAKLRDRLRFELKEMQERLGITSVYVTHDLDEALALADRLAVMQGGRISQLGSPEEIYRRPASAFVADFLGFSNLIAATVRGRREHDSGVDVVFGSGEHAVSDCAEPASPASGESLGTDSATTVCIRPRDVTVSSTDPRTDVNTWKGVVSVCSFLGGQLRYKVRISADVAFDVLASDRAERLYAGDTAYLHVDPANVMLLPADEELAVA